MILVNADRLTEVREHLLGTGYAVATVTTPAEPGLRTVQALIAQALLLPPTAARNLDALADSLRDLPQIFEGQPVALVWEEAERLARADGQAWWILGEILDDAEHLTVVATGVARLGQEHEER